ncbi:MAG: heme lyase CcmF/NrfE family subunit [Thiotrichales bacterium]|jgi:cytochrome c-type biogenesis protein CcmF|nr:heme lyase CcmF/NrfE family subunit [Thiotrichales bacterium]MBT3613053.1 heme lyase CcmF/NrfE family subunit [Thiotrichales bacterium]MBT3751955.1 heme lyase CcmF/NrfE family subunit [Thiotrichales bacterium]MBT3837659.1 heme lyase CcmF/NrfE family subunit [Thiotrichales bacterium]MBT4152303.1 heme lyase CcmF/NrfE family subunit [Thiotrichales bacterium]
MIPEIGNFALMIALAIAIVQGVIPLIGAQLGISNLMAIARPAAQAQFLFMTIAIVLLGVSFVTDDFSVRYVATNSNSLLPMIYKASAVWGGHEGSLLLWAFMLSGWGAAVTWFSKSLPFTLTSRALAILGLVGIGFLLFLLLTSNPFERLIPAALDGRDLNPLLQDPGLIIHPPLLYMGYVGFAIPFAFVIAALIGGQLDATWARWSRPWTAMAWVFLSLGIGLGSWWAYYELGWGGWWFWDPVENASFMPWLMGTALLHSLAVTEKRGAFKAWTVLLAIFAFSLSLLGTFLVRSGVLVSVHAFAADPTRGIFILFFLVAVIGGSLALYAWRAPMIHSGGKFKPFSRETLLLINNVLLVVATLTVLIGTLYPLILDSLDMGKISVGPPYFDNVFVPIMLPMSFLIGLSAVIRWKADQVKRVASKQIVALVAAIVVGGSLPHLIFNQSSIQLTLSMIVAVWIIFTMFADFVQKVRRKVLSRNQLAMLVGHTGLAFFIIGVGFTTAFSIEKDVRMEPGSKVEAGGYTFLLDGLVEEQGPNYTTTKGLVYVYDSDNNQVAALHPEKRLYTVQKMPMTEASIDEGLFRDLYVAMGEPIKNSRAWAMRVYYKPFIQWIWLGVLIMSLGGIIAAFDPRYRRIAKQARRPI